jgi:predicted HTH domain antitoxin
MSLVISDEVIKVSGLSEQELLLEVILMLFQQKRVSIGKASRLSGMTLRQFQHELATRKIPVHYDVEDFEKDLQNLREAGRL